MLAKDKYGYNGEQALGMLFWHKHDLERAMLDLANFTPFPDEWSVEDKVLFEQAFQFHGKSFHRIRQMVSHNKFLNTCEGSHSTNNKNSILDLRCCKKYMLIHLNLKGPSASTRVEVFAIHSL